MKPYVGKIMYTQAGWKAFLTRVLLSAVLMGTAAAGASCLGTPEGSTQSSSGTSSASSLPEDSQTPETSAETTATPAETTSEPAVPSDPPAGEIFGLGETAQVTGLEITLISVNDHDGNDLYKPEEGEIFLFLEWRIENKGEESFVISSADNFDIYADGEPAPWDLRAQGSENLQPVDGALNPGDRIEGILAISAPIDWQLLEMDFLPRWIEDSRRIHFVFRR